MSIGKHHANWRLRAIDSLEERKPEDLHYSAEATLARKDAEKIRELLLAGLRTNLELIAGSKEEEAYVYCFDFFPLGRG